jgi:inner membrane protein
MENLTHSLFGVALYRSGLDRYLPDTLLFWIIGANLPDIDSLAGLGGSIAYLQCHRGLIHSALGVIVLAVLLASAWWLRQWSRGQPLPWLRLLLGALLAVGSHPLLDAWNNYGVRPLLPFSNHWFYGDLVFIADPWIWLMLGGAIFLSRRQGADDELSAPIKGRWAQLRALLSSDWIWLALALMLAAIMSLSGRVATSTIIIWLGAAAAIAAARKFLPALSGARVARGGLAALLCYLILLCGLQQAALAQARRYLSDQTFEPIARYSVSPTPANPLAWEVFAESASYFYFGALDLRGARQPLTAVFVDRDHWAVRSALATREGRTMAEFCRYLLAEVEATPNGYLVILRDGRFAHSRRDGFAVVKIFVPGRAAPDNPS